MTQPLFAYGTLMDADILGAVLGRLPPDEARLAASAPDYRAVFYPGRAYPALVPGAAAAPGLLLFGLTATEWQALDRFEGDEYRRAALAVATPTGPVAAQAYFPTLPIPEDAAPWTLDLWRRHHRPHVLAAETALARSARRRG